MLIKCEAELNKLNDELVPATGKADSLAGEMIRATERIGYRYFNDGDHIGIGYGKETCNAPARFLMQHGNDAIESTIMDMWGTVNEQAYEALINTLAELVIAFVTEHPETRQQETEDMWDHFNKDEDEDTWDDEDDDEYYEEAEDEYDDCF